MKKQNKSIFAYVQGPTHNRYQCLSDLSGKYGSKSSGNLRGGYRYHMKKEQETQLGSSGIYQEIVGQMEPEYYQYLNKLIDKSKKQENKQRTNTQKQKNESEKIVFPTECQSTHSINPQPSPQQINQSSSYTLQSSIPTKNPIHERTKSYADILIEPARLDQQIQKMPRPTHNKFQTNKIFLSAQNSPKIPKPHKPMKSSRKENEKEGEDKNFLGYLDRYIDNLTSQRAEKKSGKQKRLEQRRTISKSNFNSTIKASPNQNIKYNNYNESEFDSQVHKQVKTLKFANNFLENQHNKIKKKYSSLKQKTKFMAEEITLLKMQLEEQRNQRNKMEIFFQELQARILSVRPERKTIGRMQSPQSYLLSQTTQQDDQSFSELENNTKKYDLSRMILQKKLLMPKRITKNRKSMPRSGNQYVSSMENKYKQPARSLTREELTTILAEKYDYGDDDFGDSEDSQQIDIIQL